LNAGKRLFQRVAVGQVPDDGFGVRAQHFARFFQFQ
jgi:hypothetical protein